MRYLMKARPLFIGVSVFVIFILTISSFNLLTAKATTEPIISVKPFSTNSTSLTLDLDQDANYKISINGVEKYNYDLSQGINQVEIGLQTEGTIIKLEATSINGDKAVKEITVFYRAVPVLTHSTIYENTTVITGKADPLSRVIMEMGREYAEVKADAQGNYSLPISKQKTASTVWLTTITKYNEEKMLRIKVIDRTAPPLTYNQISNKTTAIKGKTEAKATVRLYISNQYKGKTTAKADGSYSLAISKQKAGTKINLTSTSTNTVKRVKEIKGIVVVDKIAPKTPTVKPVYKTSTSVKGKAEAKSTVYVYKGKKYLGKSVATSKGNYSVKIAKQKAGTKLTVFAKDKAKNKSAGKVITVKK